jgi:hypothetical protein
VARGAVSQLAGSTGEKKRARGKHRSDILTGTSQRNILKDVNGKKIEEKDSFYERRTSDRNLSYK